MTGYGIVIYQNDICFDHFILNKCKQVLDILDKLSGKFDLPMVEDTSQKQDLCGEQ